MTIHELMLKRFATKQFDPTKKISDEDLNYILACAHISCSSINTQPWHFTVITNPELRTKLQAASYGQAQIVDASHLIVVSTVKDPMVRVSPTAAIIAKNAGQESADRYLGMAKGSIAGAGDMVIPWLQRQVYLPLQAMILAAMERGIDSCPMEGFDPKQYAEILGYTDKVPTCLLTLGYAAQPGFPKVRVPMEDIVTFLK